MSDVRMTWHGQRVSKEVAQAAVRGLRDGAEHLLTTANYTIPLETGDMMRSGVPDVDEERLEASVSYDTPYAVTQHEDTTLRHDPGRRAKWLEETLNEERRKIQSYIEVKIKDALRG